MAGYDDAHGESARDVLRSIKEDMISVREVISISETKSRVDAGEMGCLDLCRQEQILTLVTDNWRALPKLIVSIHQGDVKVKQNRYPRTCPAFTECPVIEDHTPATIKRVVDFTEN